MRSSQSRDCARNVVRAGSHRARRLHGGVRIARGSDRRRRRCRGGCTGRGHLGPVQQRQHLRRGAELHHLLSSKADQGRTAETHEHQRRRRIREAATAERSGSEEGWIDTSSPPSRAGPTAVCFHRVQALLRPAEGPRAQRRGAPGPRRGLRRTDFIVGSHNRYGGEIGSGDTESRTRTGAPRRSTRSPAPWQHVDQREEGEHRRIHELPGRVHLDRRDRAHPAAPQQDEDRRGRQGAPDLGLRRLEHEPGRRERFRLRPAARVRLPGPAPGRERQARHVRGAAAPT